MTPEHPEGTEFKRGQVYGWRGLRCEVTRVAKDRSWVDIRVHPANPFSLSWTKRLRNPREVLTEYVTEVSAIYESTEG